MLGWLLPFWFSGTGSGIVRPIRVLWRNETVSAAGMRTETIASAGIRNETIGSAGLRSEGVS